MFVAGGGNEEEAAGGDDGAAVVFGAGGRKTAGAEFGIFAEGNLPAVASGVQIDGGEGSPGRLERGVPVGVEPAMVTG